MPEGTSEIAARAVRAGEQAIEFDGSPAAQRDGKSVTLDRGALREVYHLTKNTLEQTFVFDRVETRGELLVRLDVETDLAWR